MFVYFSLAIISYFFLLMYRINKQKNKILSYILVLIPFLFLWLISSFRYFVGSDFAGYYTYINRIDVVKIKFSEYGFWVLGKLTSLFTTNGQIFIAVTSFIIICILFVIIIKESKYPELSILLLFGLGFYFTSLNIVRQYIAIAIVFYAVTLLAKNKQKMFVLLVLFATFFHTTAIVAMLLLIINKLRYSTLSFMNKVFIVLGAILIFIFYERVLGYIIIGDYKSYEDSVFFSEGANSIFFIIYFFITIVIYIFRKKLIDINPNNELYILVILFGTAITLIGTKSLIFIRIAEYFTIVTILILPDIVKIINNKHIRTVVYFYFASISFIAIYVYLNQNLGEVIPYQTFWE